MCFIDIKKAFPSVRRSSLLTAMHRTGVQGPVWHFINEIYTNNTSRVVVGGVSSGGYTVANGVREGAILSPILYTIFLDELLKRLRAAGRGCAVFGRWGGVQA